MSGHGVFWSIVWKDYRELRAFWLATVLLTVGLPKLVDFFAPDLMIQNPEGFAAIWLGWAILIPALYALGCTAVLFAGEHERGTHRLLQTLPIGPVRLLMIHTVSVLGSTLLMLGVTCGDFAMSRHATASVPGLVPESWTTFGIVSLELYVWGVLFSLICRRVIVAVILGGVVSACTVAILPFTLSAIVGPKPSWGEAFGLLAMRAPIVVLVAAVDIWLVRRWFRDDSPWRHDKQSFLRIGWPSSRSVDSDRPSSKTTKPTSEFGRLLWQQWWQSRRLLAGFGVAVLLVTLICLVWPRSSSGHEPNPLMLLLLVAMPLLGSCVFREDWQEDHFRYLAEHGARPGRVWWSRQLIWFAAAGVVILTCLLLLAWFTLIFPARQDGGPTPGMSSLAEAALLLGAFMVTAYACGQFASIYFRSSILAVTMTFVLLVVLAIWVAVVGSLDWLLCLSVIPIALVLLVATRLRTRDWMLERAGWRAWARAVLVVVLPIAVMVGAIPFYRVYSVPAVEPGFSVKAFTRPATPDELATEQMYRKAWATHRWPKGDAINMSTLTGEDKHRQAGDTVVLKSEPLLPEQIAWIKANAKAIDLAVRASRRPWGPAFDPRNRSPEYYRFRDGVRTLGQLVASSAEQLAQEGKLDEALDRYLAALSVSVHLRSRSARLWMADQLEKRVQMDLLTWAAHADQTPERLKRALDEVTKLLAEPPSIDNRIKADWVDGRLRLADADTWSLFGNPWEQTIQRAALKWLPWEKARAKRILNYCTRENLAAVHRAEKIVKNGQRFERRSRAPSRNYFQNLWRRSLNHESTCLGFGFLGNDIWWVEEYVATEMRRRALRLQLALAVWRREHGQVPKSLDELVGTYLDAVPIDPFTGLRFIYSFSGHPGGAVWQQHEDQAKIVVEKGVGPFLWSPGWRVFGADGDIDEFQLARPGYDRGSQQKFLSPWDMLRAGWIFPVPQPPEAEEPKP